MPSLIFGLPDVSFHFLSPPLRFALRSREAATMEEAVAGKKSGADRKAIFCPHCSSALTFYVQTTYFGLFLNHPIIGRKTPLTLQKKKGNYSMEPYLEEENKRSENCKASPEGLRTSRSRSEICSRRGQCGGVYSSSGCGRQLFAGGSATPTCAYRPLLPLDPSPPKPGGKKVAKGRVERATRATHAAFFRDRKGGGRETSGIGKALQPEGTSNFHSARRRSCRSYVGR